MVRRKVIRWNLAALALAAAAARPVAADPINFTGNVDQDFANTPGTQVSSLVVSSLPNGSPDPSHVVQDPYITANGWTTGWSMKDIRLSYDKASDTMSVGVGFFSIAGDADGNPNYASFPNGTDPMMKAAGGVNNLHLGGRDSISVGFDFTGSGTPQVVAGVPADKTKAGPGTDGFSVAAYQPSAMGLEYNYGANLANNQGSLAFDPSKAHPDFEFTIKNFSKLPGYDPTKGFYLSAFAGSPDDVVAGEDAMGARHITLRDAQFAGAPAPPPVVPTPPPTTSVPQLPSTFAPTPTPLIPPPQQVVPEPATALAWSAAVIGGLAIRLRRRLDRRA